MFITVTCEEANVTFDVVDDEADDYDDTYLLFELFSSTVGS
jgi:hypothetical protein